MSRGTRLQSLALVLGVAAAALAGCAANGGDEGLLVLKNVVPMASTGGGCSFSSQQTEVSLVRGSLDVSFKVGYVFIAQVASRITALTGQEAQRTVFTRGANVDLTFVDTTLFTAAELDALKTQNLTHFMAPFTAPISPNGGVTDVLFELIPPDLSAALAAKSFMTTTLQASFTIVGDLAGGDVTSQKFQYTVTLANGGFRNIKGTCASLSASFTPKVGSPCNPFQDGSVDCCTVLDSMNKVVDVCPAVGQGP